MQPSGLSPLIAWFARNDVAANLMMAAILIWGMCCALFFLPLEVFPTFETDVITVSVSLPGAGPEETEEALAIKIEESLQDVTGIKRMTSNSGENGARVVLEAKSSKDVRELLEDVKTRVDAINTFPVDAENPVIRLVEFRVEVITIIIAGKLNDFELKEYAEDIRVGLSRLPGVSDLQVTGVRDYEVIIEVPHEKLRQYELSLSEIAEAVSRSSLDLTAGNVRTSGGDILVRSIGQAYRRDDFESIVIRTFDDGSILRVGDVARVVDGFEENNLKVRYNGLPAATIVIDRSGNDSAIQITRRVQAYLKEQRSRMPDGVVLSYWDDNSRIVKGRLQTLMKSALQGGILVILLLSLFLRPTVAFPVFLGIPVSFAGALIVMWIFGISINIISLFAFILVLGVVVDDAIVTGENIYRHLPHSPTSLDAAIHGTKEVAVPVTFGILTTVAAFAPIIYTGGDRGAVFAQIPAVVIPALLFSLLESKLVLPAHLKWLRKRDLSKTEQSRLSRIQNRISGSLTVMAKKYYRPLLALCLRHRYTTLCFFTGGLLLVITLVFSGWVHYIFFPRVESEEVKVRFDMSAGAPEAIIDDYTQRIARAAFLLKEKYSNPDTGESVIKHIFAVTGGSLGGDSRSTRGEVIFELKPPEEREIEVQSTAMLAEWRQLIGVLPGAESVSYEAELGRSGAPIDIQLSSQDLDALELAVEELKKFLGSWPGVFSLSDNLADGKQELKIELLEEAYLYGLTRQSVARQVRQAFYGDEVQRIQRGRDDVRVKVRHPLNERRSIADIQEILIRTPDGGRVPLGQVVELVPGKGPATIIRNNGFRTVSVTADIDKQTVIMPVLKAEMTKVLNTLTQRWPQMSYQFEGEILEQEETFATMKWGLLFTLFAIYCLLAIPFRSYLQPLIVMSIIPFALIGVVLGHLLMSKELSMMSVLGTLALVGVVVNDSLMLVDFINRRASSRNPQQVLRALLSAGQVRMRPVILTSLTTFIGLLPLLFDNSTQAQFLVPMAISLGFGIIFSTLNTLLLVPVNYLIVEDIKGAMKKLWAMEFRPAEAVSNT